MTWAPCLLPLSWVWPMGGAQVMGNIWVEFCLWLYNGWRNARQYSLIIRGCTWGIDWGKRKAGARTCALHKDTQEIFVEVKHQKELKGNTALTQTFPAWLEMQVRRQGEKATSWSEEFRLRHVNMLSSASLLIPSSVSLSLEAGLPMGVTPINSALCVDTSTWDSVPNPLQWTPVCYTNPTIL